MMIWLCLGIVAGVVVTLAAVTAYGGRVLRSQQPADIGLEALDEVRRVRNQTIRDMVSAKREVYVPARSYWAVMDGTVTEHTVPRDDVIEGTATEDAA